MHHCIPFLTSVLYSAGNPQILGQKPVTYFRQVLSIIDYPDLLASEHAASIFPSDVLAMARELLSNIPGGSGSYSESQGVPYLRSLVAKGVEKRDGGHVCQISDLWLTDGASPAVHYVMRMLLRNENDVILTPIPQYPLYSATIKLYGGTLLPYYLDEKAGWATTASHLTEQVQAARDRGLSVRALVVINPGNPTGQVLERVNQEELLQFCASEGLVLIADEVYQTNVYAEGKSFVSFKKVLSESTGPASKVPLVSLNSISKGYFGECGRRGGYMEVINFPADVKQQLYKLSSISLCPNVNGQVCCALMMNPPQQGSPSYELYRQERDAILSSLKRRAKLVVDTFNKLEGVSCNPVEGAMYAFPKLSFPERAIQAAEEEQKRPDFVYCMELLDKTGIVTVPGSGFGQEQNTYHLRTTILPPETDMHTVAELISKFHGEYLNKWKL